MNVNQGGKMEYYEKLRNAFENSGYTQKELADKAGITSSSLCRYLDGSREPKATVLFKLCEKLNIDIYDLFANDPETLGSKSLNLISREETITMIKELADYHTGDAFNADRVIRNIKQLKSYKIGFISCTDALPDPPNVFEMSKPFLVLINGPFGREVGLFRFFDGQFGNYGKDKDGAYGFMPFENSNTRKFGYKIIAWMKITNLVKILE